MLAVSDGYSNLEFDLAAGTRGSRYTHLADTLTALSGAEDALAVNNNAAAILLALSTLASYKEVIVSRGEAVEIGGGFRIPDVLAQSGAQLVEVGTTNRTYADDFIRAITPATAAILRVHSSNFRVVGFTHEPALDALVEKARQHDIPVIYDLGSGSLLDTAAFGLHQGANGARDDCRRLCRCDFLRRQAAWGATSRTNCRQERSHSENEAASAGSRPSARQDNHCRPGGHTGPLPPGMKHPRTFRSGR